MSYYAKVKDGTVVNVISAKETFFDDFVDNSPGQWIKTSYNTKGGIHYDPTTGQPSQDQSKSLRKNFASIGDLYDQTLDAFMPPKPFPSWTLDEATCLWEAPVPMPDDGKMYNWDEDSGSWKEASAG